MSDPVYQAAFRGVVSQIEAMQRHYAAADVLDQAWAEPQIESLNDILRQARQYVDNPADRRTAEALLHRAHQALASARQAIAAAGIVLETSPEAALRPADRQRGGVGLADRNKMSQIRSMAHEWARADTLGGLWTHEEDAATRARQLFDRQDGYAWVGLAQFVRSLPWTDRDDVMDLMIRNIPADRWAQAPAEVLAVIMQFTDENIAGKTAPRRHTYNERGAPMVHPLLGQARAIAEPYLVECDEAGLAHEVVQLFRHRTPDSAELGMIAIGLANNDTEFQVNNDDIVRRVVDELSPAELERLPAHVLVAMRLAVDTDVVSPVAIFGISDTAARSKIDAALEAGYGIRWDARRTPVTQDDISRLVREGKVHVQAVERSAAAPYVPEPPRQPTPVHAMAFMLKEVGARGSFSDLVTRIEALLAEDNHINIRELRELGITSEADLQRITRNGVLTLGDAKRYIQSDLDARANWLVFVQREFPDHYAQLEKLQAFKQELEIGVTQRQEGGGD